MDGGMTTKRQYSEYSEFFSKTQREDDQDNQWDITSDGPDSTTSGSDIPEGHYDRPPEEEYSGVPIHLDDHMLDMWQKDYVLQLDNWRKQWSGCSRTWQITIQSSGSGRRLRTPDRLRTPYSRLRTPEDENSVILKYGRPYDRYVIEGPCSLIRQLEKTVVRVTQVIGRYPYLFVCIKINLF